MPPRQTWFSQECVDAWRAKNDVNFIRQKVLERDNGICALCGIDCIRVERVVALAFHNRFWPDKYSTKYRTNRQWNGKFLHDKYDHALRIAKRWGERRRKAAENRLHRLKAKGFTTSRSTMWDADHILEVVNGGGLCGLDNYQTLCHPCHKAKTARLARELAEKRRLAKAAQVGDLFVNPS